MPGEKHPIIAHGELYVEPIVKKSRPIDKSIPHEYEDAKQRILSDISNITEKIEIQEEFFLDEKSCRKNQGRSPLRPLRLC